eukprot:CAMPEP_0170544830 /NCGR_PEP_ID=MMETSP0211-20121228/3447_1 /TAXON_ID=311385 /ORGANISM="Pseudokeronopsis sp., Strain OXSARD2" /LENGTH=127 /DNA_ID=CAMNT_0010848583 /DNA_START=889 /DNA_END=1272 /DNA_ORIENTATION=-
MVNKIKAETTVKYNEILAEAKLIETNIVVNARAEAARIKAEADAVLLEEDADVEKQNAQMVAKAIDLEGDAQAKQLKAMKKKRKHLQVMERLGAMEGMSTNSDLVLTGDQGNNLLANIEAFKMVYNK